MEANQKSPAGSIILFMIILALGFWAYQEFVLNYNNVKASNARIQALLDEQGHLALEYSQQLSRLEQTLKEAEASIQRYQQENAELKQKLVLLDQVEELKQTIAQLKEENARLAAGVPGMQEKIAEMQKAAVQEKASDMDFETIPEGKALIKRIKGRIHQLKTSMHETKVAAQKEKDRVETLQGNNGFAVRNGQPCLIAPKAPSGVQVNVEFVK